VEKNNEENENDEDSEIEGNEEERI